MQTDQIVHFAAPITITPAVFKEFNIGFQQHSIFSIVCKIIIVLALLYTQSLFLTLFCFTMMGFLFILNRKGGLNYKRMVMSNGGKEVQQVWTFCDDQIHVLNPDNGNRQQYRYESVRYIFRTKNLLLLVMDLRLCIFLDPKALTGGTEQDFVLFLAEKCSNLKTRKVRGVGFGKALDWVVLVILTGICAANLIELILMLIFI